MPDAAVTVDLLEALDVLMNLAAQRTFDGVLAVEDAGDAGDVLVAQILGAPLRVNAGLGADLQTGGRADAVDEAQRDVCRLVVWKVHTQDTRHTCPSFATL